MTGVKWLSALAVLVCACGRLGFDEHAPSAGDAAPGGAITLSYARENVVAIVGTTNIGLSPAVTGAPTAFTVAPPLPAGLSLDATTGVLAGIPTQAVDNSTYTISASDGASSASFAITMTILSGYAVDTVLDGDDDDGGVNATCFSTPAGGCSLRAAFETANRHAPKQVILLGASSYLLSSALEPVMGSFEIAGDSAATTSIQPTSVHPGYGLLSLGVAQHVWLKNLSVSDFGSVDGAVANVTKGTLSVADSVFTNNFSAGSGGVLFINGGAAADFTSCTFTGNQSFGGNGWGGVIDGEGSATAIQVFRSTATQNSTPWGSFSHITTGAKLWLENSTLTDNTSTVSGTLASPGGVYTLVNDTIVHNHNTYATPATQTSSAGIYLFSAPAAYTVENTIIAFNDMLDGSEVDCNRKDLTTAVTSNGGNILGDSAQNCAMYFGTNDRLMTDPGLAAGGLGDHGGPTQTILLAPASAALDSGQALQCPAIDQRGLPRPAGARCDVGAVEMQ